MTDTDRYAKGIEVREEIWGSAGAQAKVDKASGSMREFEELVVTEYCFGTVWARDNLARDMRSMITLAMLVALGRPHEIRIHVEGALNNGVTPKQIHELMFHSAAYCGIPLAVDGYRAADEVFERLGVS
jgi:4-carboxymuconolactone decarboxylase